MRSTEVPIEAPEAPPKTPRWRCLPRPDPSPSGPRWSTWPIPDLILFRREHASLPCICKIEPSLVVVVQGAKRVLVGEHAYPYDVERYLLTSIDLPAYSHAVEATPEQPCLGLALRLDFRILAELAVEHRVPEASDSGDASLGLGRMVPRLLDPLDRLVGLLDEPDAIATLAPLIAREIHYRLLEGDQAELLWKIVAVGSRTQRIARVLDWLKTNFRSSLRVEDLADVARMSPSAFHQQFRQSTSMSPLQYQKWMRLNEARRLMVQEGHDAASASFEVGYESPSQFSREYSRLFGASPRRDVDGVRRQTPASRMGAKKRADGVPM